MFSDVRETVENHRGKGKKPVGIFCDYIPRMTLEIKRSFVNVLKLVNSGFSLNRPFFKSSIFAQNVEAMMMCGISQKTFSLRLQH